MENIFDSVGQGSFLHHPVHMSYVDGRYLLFGLSQLQFLQLLFHVFFLFQMCSHVRSVSTNSLIFQIMIPPLLPAVTLHTLMTVKHFLLP